VSARERISQMSRESEEREGNNSHYAQGRAEDVADISSLFPSRLPAKSAKFKDRRVRLEFGPLGCHMDFRKMADRQKRAKKVFLSDDHVYCSPAGSAMVTGHLHGHTMTLEEARAKLCEQAK